jgi:prevent-host-death family protein
MATWQLQTAKARLSELLRAVREHGPQVISVRGKEEYLVSLNPGVGLKRGPRTWDELIAPIAGLGDDILLPPRNEVREAETPFDDRKDR